MTPPPVTIDDIRAARATIAGRLHRTPVFSSESLARATGARRVALKAELFQRTGSFKPRGVLNRLAALTPGEREAGIVTWSAGNHAAAVASAAGVEQLDCLVFMWQGANPLKVAATEGYGADVDLEAPGPAEAYERLQECLQVTGRTFVHPFDDAHVIAGQGTVGLELLEDVPDADIVIVPVGGGGLLSGVATAVKAVRPSAWVVGVEPAGSRALAAAFVAGEPVPVESKTIADGLAPPFAGALCLDLCRRHVDELVVVSDDEIAEGFCFLYQRAKLACEPAGAAAAAALLCGRVTAGSHDTVAIVVSGGNVATHTASGILAGTP